MLAGRIRNDAPYYSAEGAQQLKDILGYWCDENGNKIEDEDANRNQ